MISVERMDKKAAEEKYQHIALHSYTGKPSDTME